MKHVLLLLVCICTYSCIQFNPPYAGMEESHPWFKLQEMDFARDEVYVKDTNASLYKMDGEVLKNVISHSQKQYFLLYSFDIFCSNLNCRFYDTVVRQFHDHNEVALLLVSAESPVFRTSIEECFKSFGYPVFMLDPYRYGSKRNTSPDRRFNSFLSEINPLTKLDDSSNSFLLLDKNMKVLLEGDYSSDTKQQIITLIQ